MLVEVLRMSHLDNKTLVLTALRHLSDRDLPALFDLVHENGSWSVPYRSDRFPFGGTWGKEAMREILTSFQSGFDLFAVRVTSATAEEDRVAVEAVAEGEGPDKAVYRNVFSFLVYVKDGKLHTIREFFDPFEIQAYVEQLDPSYVARLSQAAAR
jgi:uncharacterized protein